MKLFLFASFLLLVLVTVSHGAEKEEVKVDDLESANEQQQSDLEGQEQFGFGYYPGYPYRPYPYRPYYPYYRPFPYRPYPYPYYG